MAAPVDADLKYYAGADGNPATDTDPVGGAISTGAEVNQATANSLLQAVKIGASAVSYYAVAYRKNEEGAGGSLNSAKFYLRTGGEKPASSGVVSAVSTSASDTGTLWIAYKHGSSWISAGEEITMAGLSTATGLTSVDSGSDWVAIYNSGSVPVGDISIYINSVKVGQIYGSAGGNGNYCASTLYTLALATAQNAAISASNRITAPGSGISSFTTATYWPGNDSSVAIPSTDLGDGNYIGYCLKLTVPANMTKPPTGEIVGDVDLFGNDVA